MKRLLAFLLAILLLTGCTALPDPTEPQVTPPPTETEAPLGPALYRESGAVEQSTNGAVWTWPLERNCGGVLLMGNTVLLYFSGEQTQLNAYVGEDLRLKTSVSRYPRLPEDGNGIQITDQGLSYYSPEENALVVLDKSLREIHKHILPDNIQGIPVVSPDLRQAYYSTGGEIRVLDLSTGIGHLLRQQPDQASVLTGSCLDGTLLVMVTESEDGTVKTSFLRSADGLEVGTDATLDVAVSGKDLYFLHRGTGGIPTYLFGKGEEPLNLFTPAQPAARVFPVLELEMVVTAWEEEDATLLECYDLNSGLRTAAVTLPGITGVRNIIADPAGNLWFLNDQNTLCRWTPAASGVEDETVYTALWETDHNPDADALADCRAKAEALGQKYGVALRLWRDAITAPWERLTAENRVEVYTHMLEVTDQVLGLFPEGFLSQLGTVSDNGLLTVSLVADAGPQGSQQTWLNGNAHLAVEPGDTMDAELLRSIYRVMDTYVLGKNSMLDDWKADKPAEDRAQLFVDAMMPDNGELFDTASAQRELRTLCRAIRDAFEMKKYESQLPWEQYLEDPLY